MNTPGVVDNGNRLVLVEGPSDQAAILTIAASRGMDSIKVREMGGAGGFVAGISQAVAKMPRSAKVAVLCDEAELSLAEKGIEGVVDSDTILMPFVCRPDLEGELITGLGTQTILNIFEGQGELAGFRRMQNQPAWRDGMLEDQIRRFIGVKAKRKVRYGRLLAARLEPDQEPAPLAELLEWIQP